MINKSKYNKKQVVANRYRNKLIKNATPSERRFTRLLKHCNTKPKFEFQKQWIEGEAFYISDFYFKDSNCTIELDGGHHYREPQKSKDALKAAYLLSLGIQTIRITNKAVSWMSIEELDNLLKKLGIA